MKPRHLIPAILLLALLLAYPLSTGPVLRWYWNHPKTPFPSAWQTFYRPLNALCHHVPLAGREMDRYEELWIPDVVSEKSGPRSDD
jgi:hypothetical protein